MVVLFVLGLFILLYSAAALVCFVIGIYIMYEYADFGREDEDFKEAKLMVCLAWCPPLLLYRIIKRKLDDADKLYNGKDEDNG